MYIDYINDLLCSCEDIINTVYVTCFNHLTVSLGKHISSSVPKTEDDDTSHSRGEEETVEQILKHENSAAGIYFKLQRDHGAQLSNLILSQDVLGVVATLGKVDDDDLSR